MEQKIKELLAESLLFAVTESNEDLNLFESGYLDSFAHIELVNLIEESFDIEVPLNIIEEGRLNSYSAILKFVQDGSL